MICVFSLARIGLDHHSAWMEKPSLRPLNARARRCDSARRAWLGLAAVVAFVFTPGIAAANNDRPRLYIHQDYLEEINRKTTLPLEDQKAMLAFVLESLPDRVKVYPTESYFYFHFYYQRIRYAGNIRLDAKDRDDGKLHFAYFEDLQEWKEDAPIIYRAFDAADGVVVEKLGQLVYRVSYNGKQVVFELNGLSKVVPPPHAIGANEKYLGPVFDDSGIRFFLVFNPNLKIFHYILDETVQVADQLRQSTWTNRILIGIRTGFAYYLDLHMNRKILIGVFEGNSRANNYFDGPFDQLPDSFVQGDELRDAILAVEPSLAGQIDRVGGAHDGSSRYMIAPYLAYRLEQQLYVFHQCATSKQVSRAEYYRCFVIDLSDYGASPVLPLPLKRLAEQASAQKVTKAKRKPK